MRLTSPNFCVFLIGATQGIAYHDFPSQFLTYGRGAQSAPLARARPPDLRGQVANGH